MISTLLPQQSSCPSSAPLPHGPLYSHSLHHPHPLPVQCPSFLSIPPQPASVTPIYLNSQPRYSHYGIKTNNTIPSSCQTPAPPPPKLVPGHSIDVHKLFPKQASPSRPSPTHPLLHAPSAPISLETELHNPRFTFTHHLRIRASTIGITTVPPDKELLFGCNLVYRPGLASVVTVVGTRLCDNGAPEIMKEETMASPEASLVDATLRSPAKSDQATSDVAAPETPPKTKTAVSSPEKSFIEDSVGAMDDLEDTLDAVVAVTQIDRVDSSDEEPSTISELDTAMQHLSLASPENTKTRCGSKNGFQSPSAEIPSSPTSANVANTTSSEQQKGAAIPKDVVGHSRDEKPTKSKTTIANKKLAPSNSLDSKTLVFRPSSLLPPKPLAKSAKPPTVSNFVLPGEMVSRRLREEREARVARKEAEEKARIKPRPSVARPLGKPTFELPGEAISRFKKERAQERFKEQQKKEREARVFEARPIRASLSTPSSVPRETVASRARKARLSVLVDDTRVKRHDSVMGTKSQRELMAKLAREKFAEQSRQAGREWAEKQRRKKAVGTNVAAVVSVQKEQLTAGRQNKPLESSTNSTNDSPVSFDNDIGQGEATAERA